MKSLVPLILSLLPFLLPAQESRLENTHGSPQSFEFLNTGQSSRNVIFRFQDSRGFIWGADENYRPMRFDGDQITIFQNDPSDSTSVSSGAMATPLYTYYLEDRQGKIWIANLDGQLDRYDPETEEFHRFRPRLVEAGQSDNIYLFSTVLEDQQGKFWIAGGKQLFEYDPLLDSIRVFSFSNFLPLLFEDAEQNLWAHIIYGDLVRVNRENGAIEERISYPEALKPKINRNWSGYYRDRQFFLKEKGSHLLVIRGWLYEFDPQTRTIRSVHHNPLAPEDLICTFWASDSLILLGTFSGKFLQYHPDTESFSKPSYFNELSAGSGPQFSKPYNLFQSREGIFWANAFQGKDVYLNVRLFPRKLAFSAVPLPSELQSLNFEIGPGDYCFSWNGEAWFFTQPWLMPVDPATQEKKKIDLTIPGQPNTWDLTYQFETDAKGHLWQVATPNRNTRILYIREFAPDGALVKTHASFGLKEITDPSFSEKWDWWSAGSVHDIKFDQEGKLWVGMINGGLFCYDPSNGSFQNFKPDFEGGKTTVLTVWIDREDNVWCGGHFGLRKYDQKKKEWTRYEDYGFPKGLRVNSINGDASGRIWAATTNGALAWNPGKKQFQFFNKENNFDGGFVSRVVVDQQQRVWCVETDGLYLYDPEKEWFHFFGREEGVILNGVDQTPNSYVLEKGGTIIIPSGISSVYRLDPKDLQIDFRPSSLFFTDLFLFSKKVKPGSSDGILQKALDYTDHIRLQFAQNDFTIHYTAPEYAHPDKLEFFIRMESFNDEWQNVGNKREARYTNLSPGKYTFQVKVRNHLGVESETPRSLTITILPPWYRTTWAYILWLSLTLGALYSFYRFQLRRRLAIAEAAQLKELDQAKTRLYTNITHEFRTPLTVILGMAEQVKGDPKNWFNEGLRLIGRNGKHLLYLVNQLLDLSKLESGSMPLNLVHGDVVSYLNYLTESFYSYADSKDIRLHFQTDLNVLEMDHDPEKLQHVVANLLSNAIKFTPAGGDVYIQCSVLSAQFSVKGEEALQVKVSDTGFGIAPEHLPHIFDRFYQADASATRRGEGTGIGLALTKELVKVMGGDIEVESTVGKGTKFSIQLPVTHTAQAQPAPGREHSEALLATALIEQESPAATAPVEPSDRYTVLLVEDNQDVITYLSSILSLYYSVETARNGREGIAKALELTPDLIVSDVMMPDTDGFELTETLKTDERSSHIPIILLTARADQAAKVEGLSHGADAYLTKPFHKEELLVRVEKLIEQRRKLQERFRKAGGFLPLLKTPADGAEETFLKKVLRHVEAHLPDEEYGMPQLCKAMNMSRSNLFRKLKALTGKSATDLIRSIRLEKAKALLETTEMSVSEVSYAVGFSNANYFSTVFKEEFGVSPSEVRRK